MADTPLISIVTVTFNASSTIRKTMESISAQSFKNFEHLVIDGASKDDTTEIIKGFDLPQTEIISEPDRGLYDAMNKALKLAKGKYILFLNAGDAFHDASSLEKYAREADSNADIIYGDTVIVDLEGNYLGPRHLSVPDQLTFKSFSDGMLVCHQAFMVRKELADPYDLSYRFSADYDWCVRCIAKSDSAKCKNLNKVTIDYLRDGLTDKNKLKSLKERFIIMSRHYGLIPTILRHFTFLIRSLRRQSL